MSYQSRKTLYQEIEKIRKRPLIAYVTSIRPGCQVQMASDVIPLFIKQVNAIKENAAVDLLILSNGGDPIVSWRIISILREKFKKISVLVPYTAYSAATLLALGADEVIMHPYANLGPLDPQLSFTDETGKTKTIGYEDIMKYIDFIKEIGENEHSLLAESIEKLTKELSPTLIGFAKRSSELGLTMCQKLLATHMSDSNKTKLIADALNTKYYHHGYPLSRKEAKEIGLPIATSNPQIESLLWSVFEDYAKNLNFNTPYNPQLTILDKLEKNIPSNPNEVGIIKEENKIACLESTKMNCYIKEEIIATYRLNNDMSLTSNITIKPGTWTVEECK